MLQAFYNKYDVPDDDRIPLEKNILLLVPNAEYDVTEACNKLGVSPYEVAVTWPKDSIHMFAEIAILKPKLVLQCGCNISRKFPVLGEDGEIEEWRDKAIEASADGFVGLHHHDEFSIRDGLGTVVNLVELLKKQRRSFCCVSNHGTVGGWVKQYTNCQKAGIKAVFAMEAYTSSYRGDDKERKKKYRKANHLLLIAKTREGFDNIIKIHNDAQLHGFYYSPRMDRKAARKWGKGIVATSSCFPAGTKIFTPDGFKPVNEKGDVVVLDGEGIPRPSSPTSRVYSGEMKTIRSRGIVPPSESTADHQYYVVRKNKQRKSASRLLPDNYYSEVPKQIRTARRREFEGEWTDSPRKGDWLLFPVEEEHITSKTVDIAEFKPSGCEHRVYISKRGRREIRDSRRSCGRTISELKKFGSWNKANLYRVESGESLPLKDRLVSHIAAIGGNAEKFIGEHCRPATYEECGVRGKDLPQVLSVDKHLLFLLGAYCAEGGSSRHCISFTLHIEEKEFAERIEECVSIVFGLGVCHSEMQENHKRTVTVHSVQVRNAFVGWCGDGCHNKRVPSFVFGCEFERAAYFISGYMMGDGHLSQGGRRDNGHITSVSVSEDMSLGIARILLRGGYYPTINRKDAYVDKKGLHHDCSWSVHLSGRQHSFAASWMFGGERPARLPDNLKVRANVPVVVLGRNYYTATVIDVDYQYVNEVPVYCRSVSGPSKSFVTGYSVVHNCMKGEIPELLMSGQYYRANRVYEFYKACFDEFYIEIQIIESECQREVNRRLIQFAQAVGAPLVIGCDSHYLEPEHDETHNILMCIRQKITIMDQKTKDDTWEFDVGNLYYRTAAQVRETFEKGFVEKVSKERCEPFLDDVFTEDVFAEAMANTRRIAVSTECIKLDSTIKLPKLHSNGKQILKDKINAGFRRRGLHKGKAYLDQNGNKVVIPKEDYISRLKHEFHVITKLGWTDYFLITERIISDARDEYGEYVVGYGRGSGAGSVVCYCLGITDVDPLVHGLLFERFLSIERTDAPDIDNDLDPRYREEIKRKVVETFGEDQVCSIGSYQMYRTASVIADVARTLGYDIHEVRKVTKRIDSLQAFEDEEGQETKVDNMTFEDLFLHYPDLKAYMDEHPDVLRHSKVLRNQVKNMGTHAGGVIISDIRLTDNIPVLYDKPGNKARKIISAWAEAPGKNEELSAVGLVKFDILGLAALSVISDSLKLIEETTGKRIARDELPIDDRSAIRLCSKNDLVGIFQLENPATLPIAQKVGLSSLGDVAALTSLIRPGPRDMGMDLEYAARKHGEPYNMPNFLKRMLSDTHGIVVFQEQCMFVARKLAGLSPGESYKFVKTIAKKLPDKMAEFKQKFRDGSKPLRDAGEITMEEVEEVFDTLEKFAGYGFNRAHATAYSAVSTAELWLKHNYPSQFVCALINNTDLGKKKHGSDNIMVDYINYARRSGIPVIGPDVNESKTGFSLSKDEQGKLQIRYSLSHIKYVGSQAAVIESFQPIESMADFHERVKTTTVSEKTGRKSSRRPNKRVVETLIAAGAFDSFGTRNEVMAAYYKARDNKKDPEPPEHTDEQWEEKEREAIGIVLSRPPLYVEEEDTIDAHGWLPIHKLHENRKKAHVFGRVESITPHTSKAGNSMLIVTIGDDLDTLKFFVFRGAMDFFREKVVVGDIGGFPLDKFEDSDTRFFDDKKDMELLERETKPARPAKPVSLERHVKVFPKGGKIWFETGDKDDWKVNSFCKGFSPRGDVDLWTKAAELQEESGRDVFADCLEVSAILPMKGDEDLLPDDFERVMELADRYEEKHRKVAQEFLGHIYYVMLSQENIPRCILGRRVTLLSLSNVLKQGMSPQEAAKALQGKTSEGLRKECVSKGI